MTDVKRSPRRLMQIIQSPGNTTMMGRREFGWTGLSAAAALAMGGHVLGQETRTRRETGRGADADEHERHLHADDEHYHTCAEECNRCQLACDACASHCAHVVARGHKEHVKTLESCLDCAAFCAAAARIVGRKGPFSVEICEACAIACAKCGELCEQFKDDEHMTACAKACRECEDACREMVKTFQQA